MQKTIKWFDLDRFGAAIRVIPESPLRGIATTCLEIRDRHLYQSAYGFSAELTREAQQALADKWAADKKQLGFAELAEREYDDDGLLLRMRYTSTRSQFSLTELRTLFPDLGPQDLRDMSVDEVALVVDPDPELKGQWREFASTVLAKDAVRVWMPRENPYEVPFAEAARVSEINPSREQAPFPLLEENAVARYYGLPDKLDRANYRANSLVPYYAEKEAAVADGWSPDQLEEVDLPYALPLWISGAGKIIALRDIRYAPEIMDLPPHNYYKAGPQGLIVAAIRAASEFSVVVDQESTRWARWLEEPASLNEPDQLWGSISRVVSGAVKLRDEHPRLPSHGLRHLCDGLEDTRGGTVRVKPLTELNDGHMHILADNAARLMGRDDAAKATLTEQLVSALQQAQGLISAQSLEQAREGLRQVVDQVQKPAEDGGEPFKHVDVGEKIGGARKDYGKRSLGLDDLDAMNELERKALVSKKNVWKPLDYQQMREDGVTPQAAMGLKYLKDKLNTEPDRSRGRGLTGPMRDLDPDAQYIIAIAAVRDAVADVKTVQDLTEAMQRLYEMGARDSNYEPSRYITGGTTLQVQWGRDVSTLVYDSTRGLPRKISSEIRKKVEAYDRHTTDDQRWSNLIKPKREKSEAELDAAREKKEQDRELHRPHLARVIREGGHDWRGGRDVIGDDLLHHFGFRAVEFGNWLPQDERQSVLNMAFDSFCDLASALDVSPKSLSLGGELAIAFGSRGTGGTGAALAHFEPARMVINLTRMRGAGSLAHEWMHAFDFMEGGKRGFACETNKGMASPMGELSRAMQLRSATADEMIARGMAAAQQGRQYAASWVRTGGDREHRAALDANLVQLFERARGRFAESVTEAMARQPNFGTSHAVNPLLLDKVREEIMEALGGAAEKRKRGGGFKDDDKALNCVHFGVNGLARAVTAEVYSHAEIQLPEHFLGGGSSVSTDFAKEAAKLDKSRSEAYWATPREMFARAGAAFVYDQLAARGTRCDYLVYGADEDRFKEHPVGNPNPTGKDRVLLEERFKNLIDEYRMKVRLDADCSPAFEI